MPLCAVKGFLFKNLNGDSDHMEKSTMSDIKAG